MKKFIKNITSFSILAITLIYIIQIIISLKIKGKIIMGHDNLEQASNINADLVFIGSSRCWVHFDPFFFDTTFNLKSVNIGVDGHSEISMAIVRLSDYLSRNKTPKFVIFSFDPLIYAGSFKNNTNYVHKNAFAKYAFFPSKKNLPIVDFFQFNLYEKYIPLYAILKYKNLSFILSSDYTNDWTKFRYEMHQERWDTTKIPVTDIIKKAYFKKSEVGLISKALDSLKKLCQVNNAQLLCIQTPVYKIAQDDSSFSETKNICFNLNIPFIDANKEYIRNNISYFYNSDHLNKLGVDQLNNLLKNDTLLKSFLHK
jgi:hypothetical protein